MARAGPTKKSLLLSILDNTRDQMTNWRAFLRAKPEIRGWNAFAALILIGCRVKQLRSANEIQFWSWREILWKSLQLLTL